jgi:hypothetical protein
MGEIGGHLPGRGLLHAHQWSENSFHAFFASTDEVDAVKNEVTGLRERVGNLTGPVVSVTRLKDESSTYP